MSIKAVRWVLASLLFHFGTLLGLSACSDEKPVVIQPGAFSEDWPTAIRGKLIKNKKCRVDSVNGRSTEKRNFSLKSGETLLLSGWAFTAEGGIPPDVYVQLVGPALTYTAITQTRMARPDVNQYFKLDPSTVAGFELNAAQYAEPNQYELYILQAVTGGIAECATGLFFNIE